MSLSVNKQQGLLNKEIIEANMVIFISSHIALSNLSNCFKIIIFTKKIIVENLHFENMLFGNDQWSFMLVIVIVILVDISVP